MKILIIDDDPIDRALIRRCLAQPGKNHDLDITEAANGKDGIAHAKSGAFDCIFLDYHLPDVDGIQVLKDIYDPATELAPAPVIFLTAQENESVVIDAIRFGAQDYLVKNAISMETLSLSMTKANKVFQLRKRQNETLATLNHAQKLDALGKLTGGIAHDFNNILTIIQGNTGLILNEMNAAGQQESSTFRRLSSIQKAAQRGADLVRHMMIFAHQRNLQPSETDLNQIILDTQDFIKRTLGADITIKTLLSDDLWLTLIDPNQFEHMIINLCTNARDAMPDGGVLQIQTRNIFLEEDQAQKLNLTAGSYVTICVTDTGNGIPQDQQQKVFEPFFTTKEAGKGTGLGLSMAQSFAKDSNGALELHSRERKGTSVTAYFPRISQHARKHYDVIEIDFYSTEGHETILLLDDEQEIRDLTAFALREKGYTVFESSNADQALDILIEHMDSISLIFSDIVMEGEMNGIQFAARALDLNPDVEILFTSGYSPSYVPDMNLIDGYPIIHKPYNTDDVAREIRKILDGRDAPTQDRNNYAMTTT